MSQIVFKAFIPRILGNIKSSQIRKTFVEKQIGKICSINIHRRKNENKNAYSFAFITVKLCDNAFALSVYKAIADTGVYNLYYDKKNYWEVKQYISKKTRSQTKTAIPPMLIWNCEDDHYEIRDNDSVITFDDDDDTVFCDNCNDTIEMPHQAMIFSVKYSFCSDWCRYALASDIRKAWLCKQLRLKQTSNDETPTTPSSLYAEPDVKYATVFTAKDKTDMERELDELLYESASQIQMGGEEEPEGNSKFMEMFQHMQMEEEADMNDIQYNCQKLSKRPVFTYEDRLEYEDLEDCMKKIYEIV
jgi:transcription elongation factor Elf1